jgi:hypothetical protein
MSLSLKINDQETPIDQGDLAKLQLRPSAFTVAKDVFTAAVLNGPISALAGDFLKASLTADTNQQWQKTIDASTSITFGVTPSAKCSVVVRKAGTVFPAFTDIDGDATSTTTITVPDGKGYVSIVLAVSLDVMAQGAFTSGNFGVAVGIDANDTFEVANHFLFDQSKPIRDAIVDAFSRFVLPFGPNASDFDRLAPGDMVESEFIGSLALSASLSEGFNGVLFGAFGRGGLSLAKSSPLGSVLASVIPTFSLGVSFEVDYTHIDAFRMVVLVQPSQIELRYFKRRTDDLKTTLNASATIDPGVNVTFTNQIPGLISGAAQKLVAGADPTLAKAFTDGVSQIVSAATKPIDDAVNDLNSVVPNLLSKLPTLGVGASATFERVSVNTVFGVFDFARPADPTAWKLAMSGNLQAALHQPGVRLGAGSFVENSLTKSTTLSFAFFGLQAQSVQEYFKDVTLTYAGNGQFQYRLKTGIESSSDIFGHQKKADIYFLVEASLAGNDVSNEGVTLNIVRREQNASDRSFSLGTTISLLLPDAGASIAQLLSDATRANRNVPVNVTATFASSAFSKIQATPFVNGKPQALANQTVDQENFKAFAKAVDDVASNTSNRFPDAINDYINVWARVNENEIGQAGGPPDRRQRGNIVNQVQAFSGIGNFSANFNDSDLRRFLIFLDEARLFMNLCDDLHQLATLAGDTDSSDQFKSLVDMVTSIVHQDVTGFPQEFLNAILLALVRLMGATPDSVTAPASSTVQSFDVAISYS